MKTPEIIIDRLAEHGFNIGSHCGYSPYMTAVICACFDIKKHELFYEAGFNPETLRETASLQGARMTVIDGSVKFIRYIKYDGWCKFLKSVEKHADREPDLKKIHSLKAELDYFENKNPELSIWFNF